MTTWLWTPKRMRAAQMLASGAMYHEVATVVHVTERTLYRWMRIPEFDAQVKAFEAEARDKATRVLRRNAVAAANRLVDLMDNGGRDDRVKLQASTEILDRIGVVTVTKIAPTDPSGELEYGADVRDQLQRKLDRLADALGAAAVPGEPEQ